MRLDHAIRGLKKIVATGSAGDEPSYGLVHGRGSRTTYVLSRDTLDMSCDLRVVARFLIGKLPPIDLPHTARTTLLTGYLIGHLVANAKPNVAILSPISGCACMLREDAYFRSLFDHVSDGDGNIDLGTDVASSHLGAVVAFVRAPADLAERIDLSTIERGVVVFLAREPAQTFGTMVPKPFSVIEIDLDLGDGAVSVAFWGHCE